MSTKTMLMKRTLITCVLAILAGAFPLFAQSDGHVLTDLWKQYEKAAKSDLPQSEAKALARIKEEAMKQHLPVDFYDAATAYVRAVQRRDWKQRDTLEKTLAKEVEAFNEPIVTFLWKAYWKYESDKELETYVNAHPEGFKGCHPALHRGIEHYLNGSLKPFIRTDREYALWRLNSDALKEEVAGVYPNEAIWELISLGGKDFPEDKWADEIAAWQALADKYADKAFALYPMAEVMDRRFEKLNRDNAGSDAFKQLYDEVAALEKKRKSYKGADEVLLKGCDTFASLADRLTNQSLGVAATEKQFLVIFRNLQQASVTLWDGDKKIKTWSVENPVGSFYVRDTVKLDIPVLPDSDYSLEAKSGKETARYTYWQYSLSMAQRYDARGLCVYVADCKTGIPLRSVKLILTKNGKEIANTTVKQDGFTPLPASFAKYVKDKKVGYRIQAQDGARKSRSEFLVNSDYGATRNDDSFHYNVYRDRGAYNPGDTLQFKTVVFDKNMKVVPGNKVKAVLLDSEWEGVDTLSLVTNEWGSASGSFVIPAGHRNGEWRLDINGSWEDGFVVDEFVLPTFDLNFDPLDELYLVGDDVPVSGKLVSYSGHKLNGARLRVKVSRYGKLVSEETLVPAADNTFKTQFKAKEDGYYTVDVTVTDATGETHSFNNDCYVGENLEVNIRLQNSANSDYVFSQNRVRLDYRSSMRGVVEESLVKVIIKVGDGRNDDTRLPVRYELTTLDGRVLLKGESVSGEQVSLPLPGSGRYLIKACASAQKSDGKTVEGESTATVYCLLPQEKSLSPDMKRIFVSGPATIASGKTITARVGSSEGDAWTIVTLYDNKLNVLENRMLRVRDGSVEDLSFAYRKSYPDAVRLEIFYFINGSYVHYSRIYRREKDKYSLPLQFTRFTDKAYPGTEYSFTVNTKTGVEALVAAWDKSMDAIAENEWPLVKQTDDFVTSPHLVWTSGRLGDLMVDDELADRMVSLKAMANADLMFSSDPVYIESAVHMDMMMPENVRIREEFASALTFQPHLYPEKDGTLHFKFRTSDKLSTYYVRVYAHDKQMHNAIVENEMVVSLPVKVDIRAPRYLYAGDRYDAVVTVSSISDEPVSGTLFLRADEKVQSVPVTVNPGETVSHSFAVTASEGDLTLTASFSAPAFSDAMRVQVPVYPAAQQLTEAHSAVLLPGMDRDALVQELRGRFVNVPGASASLREISVLDMVRDAIPSHVEPKNNDVLSLSEAWYVGLMASRLNGTAPETGDLLARILACRNADGGFGWFEGMNSNPMITAVVLERLAKLRDRGFEVPDVTDAVKYLDKTQFAKDRPIWLGGLSLEQYAYVRSRYSEVPFTGKTPKMKFNTKGRVLAKARHLLMLRNLLEREGGLALAKAWGVKLGTAAKLRKSIKADTKSLLEYAVKHRDGGYYYPNAVMPWRGLLESEAYAHALLAELLTASSEEVADGIRLWLMLQKETQQWDAEPAYIDAITAVLDGSEAFLNTKVLALTASYEAPFSEIKAAGNGFTVDRKFFRDGVEIQPGDSVKVGDKITVQYQIWNAENRSFVKLTAGREAALQPVQQLSGLISYNGYRNVKTAVTEYYYESYPEEKTTVKEEFFVERAGVFQAPVLTIESLYAPHYRANSAARNALQVQ